jgi:hypothetical protein
VRRRGAFFRRPGLIAAGAIVFALVLAMGVSVIPYRTPPPAPPEALARIAQKNHNAAAIAAARQRSESAASTNAVDRLRDAEEASDRANAL